MESINTKVTEKGWFKVALLISIYLAIAALLIAVMVVSKNAKVLAKDPIRYAIKEGGMAQCNCITDEGKLIFYGPNEREGLEMIGNIPPAER